MTRLLQDLRYALRTFVKAPAFTAVAVLVLGAGIGANTAIFTIVNELLFRPLSGRAGELVGVYSNDRTTPNSYRAFSYPNYADIRERADVFDALMAHTFTMVGMPAGGTTRRTFADVVSSNYFDTLGVQLAAGRTFTAEEERPGARIPVAIVTYSRWRAERLDPSFIGSTIRINSQDFTVVGVAPEGFTGTMAIVAAEIYLPLGMFDSVVNETFGKVGALADRTNMPLVLAGRVKAGIPAPQVTARLDAVSRQLEAAYPGENRNQVLTINPLPRMSTSTSPQTDGGLGAVAALLLGLSGTVLVIACLNIANMLLARGAARRRELAVRLALGASRRRVIRQLLTESLTLTVLGASLGLVLSYWATRALALSLAAVMPLPVTFSSAPDGAVLAAAIAFAALSAVASGLGPALKLTRRDLVTDLKDLGADTGGGRRFGVRNMIVIAQVALSLALLTAGGIFTRAALNAAGSNPGFSYDNQLLASVDASLAGFDETRGRAVYRALLDRVRTRGSVEAVSLGSTVPFGDTHEGASVERVGTAAGAPANAHASRIVGSDYFRTLGLKMVRGREFTRAEEESPTAPPVAIVDELLARRLFGDDDPLGQMIRVAHRAGDAPPEHPEPMQIVGIAPAILDELIDKAPKSHFYRPAGRHYRVGMHLHVRTAAGVDDQAALDALRSDIATVEPLLPVLALSTMRGFHSRSIELWALEAGARLFAALGILALLLAVIGLYGVRAYIVSQRTREIGIRMALGATPRDVMRLVLGDGLFLTGAGLAAGLPLAVLVSIALGKVFVDVGGFDGGVVAVATVALTAAALTASAIPARRATKVVPLRALRID